MTPRWSKLGRRPAELEAALDVDGGHRPRRPAPFGDDAAAAGTLAMDGVDGVESAGGQLDRDGADPAALGGSDAEAVRTALETCSATITELVRRAEQAQAEAEAAGEKIRSSAETMLEALYRRDAEVDDRVAAHRRRLEDEALGGLADLLEGGMAEARAVVAQVPAMVDEAFRARLERYEADRRESEMGMVSQLRAETELAQESRLRSFEEMMATRERVVDDRADAHDEAHRAEQRELALMRGQLSRLLTEILPQMVADAVSDAIRCLRTEQESVRRETERRAAETEEVAAELRAAVAETQAALARDGVLGRQAEAYRRALEELRSAIAHQSPANGQSASTTPSGRRGRRR